MATASEVINAIIANSSMKDQVPYATPNDLQTTGGVILNYQPFMNEFISVLVNRILFQECHSFVYDNPLKIFKGVGIPYGTDVQDSIANPAIATAYDPNVLSDVLSPAKPDVKTVYYRRNRQDKYKVTIYDETLKGAFVSSDRFNEFVQMIMNTLASGDNIDEYRLMVGCLADALDAGNVNKSEIDGTQDIDKFATDIVRGARAKFLQFGFPSSAYNSYKSMATAAGLTDATDLITWTSPDRIALVIRADVAATTDVDVLAKAFNMEKTDFLGRQVIIDSFGDGDVSSKTLAVIMDKTGIRTHDNMYKMVDTPYNAATLSRTYYLHHWETMAFSPIANAWAFVEK